MEVYGDAEPSYKTACYYANRIRDWCAEINIFKQYMETGKYPLWAYGIRPIPKLDCITGSGVDALMSLRHIQAREVIKLLTSLCYTLLSIRDSGITPLVPSTYIAYMYYYRFTYKD